MHIKRLGHVQKRLEHVQKVIMSGTRNEKRKKLSNLVQRPIKARYIKLLYRMQER